MNNKVRYGAGILLALLVLFCLGRALSLKEGLKQAEGAVLDLGDAGIGMLAAAEMLEKNQLLEEPMEFTLWEQQEDQTVDCSLGGFPAGAGRERIFGRVGSGRVPD